MPPIAGGAIGASAALAVDGTAAGTPPAPAAPFAVPRFLGGAGLSTGSFAEPFVIISRVMGGALS
jgi:hypothetical protein